MKLGLAHLGAVCMQLADGDLPLRDARLLRVTSELGPRFTPKWDQPTRSDFRRFGAYADDAGVPACSLTEAFAWLADGAPADGEASIGPLPAGARARPEFRQLEATLGAIASR